MRPPHAVYDLGHMLNEWREHGRDVRACEVCGGRWENAAALRECPGGPPPGAEIRRVRCRHCKVEVVILKVWEGKSDGRLGTWLTDSATCRSCRERVCSSNCPVGCPAAGREDKEESIGY